MRLWIAAALALLYFSQEPYAAILSVSPGQSVQQALDRAQSGDTVHLQAGTHAGPITIPRNGLTLQGSGPDSILDASQPAKGWQRSDMGAGVWEARLGYSPGAMTADGKALWRIGDRQMSGEACGSEGTGSQNLTRSANAMVSYFGQDVPYWDGIEALFGVHNGVTYVRFRNGESPDERNVRAAPDAPTITVAGVSQTQIRTLTIQGGRTGVHVTNGAQGTVIDQATLQHGQRRVWITGNASGTVVRRSVLTLNGFGMASAPGGSWDNASHRHQYGMNKFVAGWTDSDDVSILIESSSGTVIEENTLSHGILGMQLSESTSGTVIRNNTCQHFSDICLYVYPDTARDLQVSGNLIADTKHSLRFNNLHRDITAYLYANRFYSRDPAAKHIHFSPYGGGSLTAEVWVYHNSFAGAGWAVDVGVEEGTESRLPNVHVHNNLFSVTGLSSSGNPGGWDLGTNLDDGLWKGGSEPTFALPQGHRGRDSAPSLEGKPGMTATYYQDGRPDFGAVQGDGVTNTPPPVAPSPVATLPAPTNFRILRTR